MKRVSNKIVKYNNEITIEKLKSENSSDDINAIECNDIIVAIDNDTKRNEVNSETFNKLKARLQKQFDDNIYDDEINSQESFESGIDNDPLASVNKEVLFKIDEIEEGEVIKTDFIEVKSVDGFQGREKEVSHSKINKIIYRYQL